MQRCAIQGECSASARSGVDHAVDLGHRHRIGGDTELDLVGGVERRLQRRAIVHARVKAEHPDANGIERLRHVGEPAP